MVSNERKSRLITSENFLKFLQSVTDGVIVVDENGIILFSNEQAKKIFGYEGEQLVGNPQVAGIKLVIKGDGSACRTVPN